MSGRVGEVVMTSAWADPVSAPAIANPATTIAERAYFRVANCMIFTPRLIDDERSKSGFKPPWPARDSAKLQGKLDLYCDIPLSAAKAPITRARHHPSRRGEVSAVFRQPQQSIRGIGTLLLQPASTGSCFY